MSYTDDVVLVKTAMGIERGRYTPIDANFIVGTVIPWAAERGIELEPRYRNGYWLCRWRYPAAHADAEDEGDTVVDACLAALAAALKAGETGHV